MTSVLDTNLTRQQRMAICKTHIIHTVNLISFILTLF